MTRGIRRHPAGPLSFALLGALLAGCVPMVVGTAVVGTAVVATDRRGGGSQVDDELIQMKSGDRLDQAFPDGRVRVNVTSYNRMVLLTGQVPSDADKATVEQVIAKMDNVQSVINELSVGPATTLKERSNDAYITTKVRASIVDAQDLFANSIKIVTHRGVVYLMGRVTEREANHAAELARGVSGVVKVVKVFEVISEAELARMQVKTAAKPASAPASAP
ncbi:MAG TPA: BON domain-containing protein [Caldimonas sp.]|nr:BON domain-containing protein [Caldimonas sp.]